MTPEQARSFATQAGLRLKYSADLAKLHAARAPFTQLRLDDATASYIAHSEAARHGAFLTWLHRRLRLFLSDFDINGLLGTYPMHVLSTEQWRALLPESVHKEGTGRLLDIGAGRGDATSELAALFETTEVTETSKNMAKRLRKLGYSCIEGDIAKRQDLEGGFDCVSLLNVLDRCDRPLSLLCEARRLLAPGGLLLIALVLPYHPFVYDSGAARAPLERLPISSRDFEIAAAEFVTAALLPLGFDILTLSRAPYLSGGDARRALYELDDLICVCKMNDEVPLIRL